MSGPQSKTSELINVPEKGLSGMDATEDLTPLDAHWAMTEPEGQPIKDRGDAPAQAVLDRNSKAQASRRAEETKYELNKINARVEQTVAAFELGHHFQEDDKAAYFVPDLMELEKVVGDAIQKRKYQQHVTIFVVGFEEATEEKTKLLNQINDFFTVYINSIDEKQLEPGPSEVDLDQVSMSVQEALATADRATQKLSEINHEIVTYVEKLHNGKALTKSKKKLEKALSQAKDDIMSLSEKLMGAQAEIEDKEDQMTKLYKQIDIKNMETLKHKAAAENARKKLAAIDDLNSLLEERDVAIERLNKAAFDHELTIQQLTQSRELSYTKLKGTQKDSEENIQKLQSKAQNLQLLLEDTKADLPKQHRIQLAELKKEHQEELVNVQKLLQEKIDQLESGKGWASGSDEEPDATSKPASSRLTRSRKSVKNTPSRQSTQISLLPETPKTNSGSSKDEPDPSSPSTPKRLATKKSALEPLAEVPYAGSVSLDDEDKWSSIPQEVIPSAFKQYRKEAVLVVEGLQKELQTREEDHVKEVTEMTEQINETEESFRKEKSELLKQVDSSKALKEAAEEEADKALAQLETFVAEHGEMVKHAEPEKKELKKLTKEQREKYLGKDSKDSREGKKNVKGKKTKKQNPSKARDAPVQRKKSTTSLPQDGPEGQMVETGGTTGTEDVKDHEKDDDVKNEGKLDVAREAAMQLDGREKTSVDRWQQTSQPESEAHQALYTRLMSMGRMQPPSSPLAQSPPLSLSPDILEDISNHESLSSLEDWKCTESVIKKPLLDPSTIRRKRNHQKIVLHKSVQCSLPIVEKMEANVLDTNSDNSKNHSENADVEGTGVDSIDGIGSSRIGGGTGDYYIDNDNDTDMVEKEAMARHLKRILDSSQWSNGEEEEDTREVEADDGPEDERPTSAFSQRSLYEKFKAQLEQTKREVIERRSRATSMHGSLLNGGSSHRSSRIGSAVTTASDRNGASEGKTVMKTDIGTSPFLLTPESGNPRKSSITASENPIVSHYLETYEHINDFKKALSQAFADKNIGPASERLQALRPVEYTESEDLTGQMNEMTSSVQLFLQGISAVMTDYLNEEPEAVVSSLMTSRLNTGTSRLTTAPSVGVQTRLTGNLDTPPQTAPSELLSRPPVEPAPATPVEPDKREGVKAEDGMEYKRLKEGYNRLQEDSDRVREEAEKLKGDIAIQEQTYEGKLKESALNITELEETICQLQQELARLEMTPSVKPTSSAFRAPSGTFNGSMMDPLVVFTRTDTERNQKALKRGINSNRITPNQYNEVVRSMERYNAVPAKRLIHIVKKYTHHTQMKRIEGNIKKSSAIDDDVFALLKKMEALQNKRAEKWGEQMDHLAEERTKLAQQLMEALTRLEEQSGIFLIKPILSWRGSGFPPYYESKQSSYKPPKTFLRPVTREGSVIHGPAPTPTPTYINRRVNNHVEVNEAVQSPFNHESRNSVDGPTFINQAANSVHGSAVHLLGTPPQGMWSMSSSLPAGDGDKTTNTLSSLLITTPKILELEVNRLMIVQNNISSPAKPFLSDDRLVNAANRSVRSYVTVARMSTYPMPTLQPQRPSSSGTEYQRANTAVPISHQTSLPGLHVRAKSDSALNVTQPLPPIRVPTEEHNSGSTHGAEHPAGVGAEDAALLPSMDIGAAKTPCEDEGRQSPLHALSLSVNRVEETDGRTSSDFIEEDVSKPVLLPSPPNTPPGSSLRQSPANGAISACDVYLEQSVGE